MLISSSCCFDWYSCMKVDCKHMKNSEISYQEDALLDNLPAIFSAVIEVLGHLLEVSVVLELELLL